MNGSGMMISSEIIHKNGGWIDMGITEDADFTISELNKGTKAHYVKDAVLYEDQPTTVKDTFVRNTRIGRGLNKTFWKHGTRSLLKFFTTFKFTYLDMFITEFFIPIALIAVLWLPAFYIYAITYNSVIGDVARLVLIGKTAGYALAFAFAAPFIVQAILVYFLDRKKINASFFKLLPSMLLFPFFMIVYALGIVFGILSKTKWKAVGRSKYITYDEFKVKFNFDSYKNNNDDTNGDIKKKDKKISRSKKNIDASKTIVEPQTAAN